MYDNRDVDSVRGAFWECFFRNEKAEDLTDYCMRLRCYSIGMVANLKRAID